jgi:hypothetical protein
MRTEHAQSPVTRTRGGTLFSQMRQFVCGLHGHDTLLHFEGRHVSLVCASCGYESPGWSLPGASPSAADRGTPGTPLVRERRMA